MKRDTSDRLRFEILLADISARFVNLPAHKIDSIIEESQRQICECLSLELSALWQWTEDTPSFVTLTHIVSPPWGPEFQAGLNAEETFPWVFGKLFAGETLAFSTDELPAEAEKDREAFNHFGIKSTVVIPFRAGQGPFLGTMSFNTLRHKRVWEKDIVNRLVLVAQVIINALARKRFEQALILSEERLRLAADSARAGLWEIDCSTRNIWVTKRARMIFGAKSGYPITMDRFETSVHPDDRSLVRRSMELALKESEPIKVDYRQKNEDGTHRWIGLRGRLHCTATGEPDRILGVSYDITEWKNAEKQLCAHIKEIEDLKGKLENENTVLKKEIGMRNVHKNIVGRSPAMAEVLGQVEQVASTNSTVLIEGETGVGKELIANAVHRLSERNKEPLFVVNCASLPPMLVESELFGREKGAYTGAMTRMIGRFEAADKATLFLDEIAELSLEIQAKLLRVLEQGCFERLGSTKTINVDVRMIAASNQSLEGLAKKGKFRPDLYYRLNVFSIRIPPLREHSEDIPALVWAFVRQFEGQMGKRISHIPQKSMDLLQQYHWPGNVRELRNTVERAMIVCGDKTLGINPPLKYEEEEDPSPSKLLDAERNHILKVLNKTGWRISGQGGAAEILGLKRTTLQSKMKKLGIQRPPIKA
ncbi:MAG: sigma 54-interacting transcriptional regulator [Desulfarculaceae bacterium]|nr:sigma 54-interacting transcriptional regulator [Desulfarculaceae bacterium]MCF8072801.1 sigma 54-interacting transcriptional regulator [Desulfarculaceae bacterium]MCF8100969.1 sigma 54-interacting transcriptional regulator [Desulfarculaceae bacterium]MCF8118533.1 sigma 54-interacting transcriptional regulator [Desulfarculaceae bacterium]